MGVFLLNWAPTKSLGGKTPFEAWYERKLTVCFLHIFGYLGYVKDKWPNLLKLDDRSTQGRFRGVPHARALVPMRPHLPQRLLQ